MAKVKATTTHAPQLTESKPNGADHPGQKWETISALPADFNFAKWEKLLASDEEKALEVVRPALGLVANAVKVFERYQHIIVALRNYYCVPGRPKKGRKSWDQVCKEYIGVTARRVRQLLASLLPPPKDKPKLKDGAIVYRLKLTWTAKQNEQFKNAVDELGEEQTQRIIFEAVVDAARKKVASEIGSANRLKPAA